jgi:hypothetical protein
MNEREAFEVPRHIATAPDGRRLLHRVFYLSERDLSRLLVHALRVTAPGEALALARERLAGILEDLASADGAARARGVRALLLLVNSGDEHAAAIVQGLESLGLPPGTRAAIAGGLRASAISAPEVTLRGLLRDSDREVRRAAFTSMSELAANEAMLAELAPELGTKDGQLRETLFAALGIERKADEVRVHAPGVANRWMLIEQLVGTPEAGRVQDIEPALEIVSAEGRNRIIRALGRRAAADEWARKPLLRTLSGPGRVAALRALAPAAAAAKPPSPLVAAFTEGIRSGDPLVREEALRAVGTHEIPVDAEALAESLAHPWPAVRIQAGLALWRLGDRRGQTILFAAMHDLELGARVRAALGR